MKVAIEDMVQADIAQVVEVDRDSYPLPWPASAYRRELSNNRHARYIVLREVPAEGVPDRARQADEKRSWRDVLGWPRPGEERESRARGRIVGYAGMWLVADEAHITTIAVRNEARSRGFGELLLASLIDLAYGLGIRWVTLEVRVSNNIAQRLYRKYGFRNSGLRKRYYSDNNEDAAIMTTDDITLNAYQAQFQILVRGLGARFVDRRSWKRSRMFFTSRQCANRPRPSRPGLSCSRFDEDRSYLTANPRHRVIV